MGSRFLGFSGEVCVSASVGIFASAECGAPAPVLLWTLPLSPFLYALQELNISLHKVHSVMEPSYSRVLPFLQVRHCMAGFLCCRTARSPFPKKP